MELRERQNSDDEVASTKVLEAHSADCGPEGATCSGGEPKGVAQASVEIREREIKRLGLVLSGRDYGVMSTDPPTKLKKSSIN